MMRVEIHFDGDQPGDGERAESLRLNIYGDDDAYSDVEIILVNNGAEL